MSTPTPTRSPVGRLGRLLVIALVPLLAAMVLVWSTSHRQEKVDKIPVAVVNNDTIITDVPFAELDRITGSSALLLDVLGFEGKLVQEDIRAIREFVEAVRDGAVVKN